MVGTALKPRDLETPEGEKIEYRIKPVTRYFITRFERTSSGACSVGGAVSGVHFDNAQTAYDVAYALCKADHERMGWPMCDERIQYPRHPDEESAQPVV
jgi:hypothetical protein